MANPVSWKGLYKGSGGGSGASFTRKVIKPNEPMPYKVGSFQKLVIPSMPNKVTLDISGLKPDDAFQVFDAGRSFEQNPVLIQATTAIEIADAGSDKDADGNVVTHRDLSLDMVGAGQVWEFVLVQPDEEKSDLILVASDSPGYLGAVSGGGGGGGGGTGNASGIAILTGDGHPSKALSYPVAGLGGPQPILYIDKSPIAVPGDVPTNILRTYVWPANTPDDDNSHSKWQATQLATLEQINWKTDEIDKDHKLLFTGEGSPTSLGLGDLIDKPNPANGKKGYVSAIYLDTKTPGGTGFWVLVQPNDVDPRVEDPNNKPGWVNIGGGGGGGGGFNRDDFLRNWIDPMMIMRAPLFVGQTDPNLDTSLDVGGGLDSLYMNTATGQWFMWPKGNMIVVIDEQGNKSRRPDAQNLWKPIGGGGGVNQRDFTATGNNQAITAAPGDLIVVNFTDFANDIADFPITLPTPVLGGKPISVLFTGGLSRTPQNNQAAVMIRDAEIVITSPVAIIGAWDDFESGDKSLNLDMAGELIEFSPFTLGDGVAWLITNSNYVSEDAHMKIVTRDYNAVMGDSLIVFGGGTITLPDINNEKDLDPITIVFNYRRDIVGDLVGNSIHVISAAEANGAQDVIQGYYNGKKLTVNPESKMGQPTALDMADGDWVTLTPYKAPTAGSFWLITGSNGAS